jgi:chromosomal replication initiation ATPase DnaA
LEQAQLNDPWVLSGKVKKDGLLAKKDYRNVKIVLISDTTTKIGKQSTDHGIFSKINNFRFSCQNHLKTHNQLNHDMKKMPIMFFCCQTKIE